MASCGRDTCKATGLLPKDPMATCCVYMGKNCLQGKPTQTRGLVPLCLRRAISRSYKRPSDGQKVTQKFHFQGCVLKIGKDRYTELRMSLLTAALFVTVKVLAQPGV